MKHSATESWYDYAWNPVTGCDADCDQCTARDKVLHGFCGNVRMNMHQAAQDGIKREGVYRLYEPWKTERGKLNTPFGFEPTLHTYKLAQPATATVPANIAVCRMGDLFCYSVPDSVIKSVMDACAAAPWHNYLFTTMHTGRLYKMVEEGTLPKAANMYYGTIVDGDKTCLFDFEGYKTFALFEREPSRLAPTIEWAVMPMGRGDALVNDRTLIWTPEHRAYPEGLVHREKVSAAQRKRLYDRCVSCKKEMRCNAMYQLWARKERGTYGSKLGYICPGCLAKLRKSFEMGGCDNG